MGSRIHDFQEKIKSYGTDIFVVLFVALLVTLGVGIWQLSLQNKAHFEPRYIKHAFEMGESEKAEIRAFVASKNGTKFYPIDCKSANSIKPENRIYFASALEAGKAGFERTSQCK